MVLAAAEKVVVVGLLNAQCLTEGQFRMAAVGVESQEMAEVCGPVGAMCDLMISIKHKHVDSAFIWQVVASSHDNDGEAHRV